jgi:hypothetical protein
MFAKHVRKNAKNMRRWAWNTVANVRKHAANALKPVNKWLLVFDYEMTLLVRLTLLQQMFRQKEIKVRLCRLLF